LINKSNLNRLLYILLAVFSLIFFVQGSVPLRNYNSDFIFKTELFFVLLCILTNRTSAYKTLLQSKLLQISLIAWIIYWVAQGLIGLEKELSFDISYLFKMFHGVFVVFAVAVYQEFVGQKTTNSIDEPQTQVRNILVFAILCVLTFSIGLIRVNGVLSTSNLVFQFEVVFILACVFISNTIPSFSFYLKNNRATTFIFVSWILAVVISYNFSSYEISQNPFVYERLDQTITHGIFFVFSYDFMRRTNINKQFLPLMVPISVFIVAGIFIVSWLTLKDGAHVDWFELTPMNNHIRHVGYVATASASIALAFSLYPVKLDVKAIILFLLLLVSATLLFWTGGRAAVGSIILVFAFMVFYLAFTGNLGRSRLSITFLLLISSFILAEQLKVFDWNGIMGQLSRTVNSENVNSVTTGRLGVWQASIESLKGNWLFGLGPQGYLYMPNRIWGAQPHNMFIQFLVEWGVVGTILFLLLLSIAGLKLLHFIKTASKLPSVLFFSGVAVFVGLSIHGLTDGTYYHSQPSYYIALALALCLSEMTIQKNETE